MEDISKAPKNPYLDACRVWNERYGALVSSRRFLQIMTIISSLTTLIALVGLVWFASQKKYIPYAIEIDKTGTITNVQTIGSVDEQFKSKIIRKSLSDFIEDFRDVVLDAQVERKNITNVYKYLLTNTPAFTKITQYYKENDPFERAKENNVFAEVTNILQVKDGVWQVEWKEAVMDRRSGQILNNSKYKLVVFVSTATPKNEVSILQNPLGLIINDINWSKDI